MSIQIQVHKKQEYYNLVPRPSQDQYESLKLSIVEDGQQLPIYINEEGTILDGHTRYDICNELGIEPFYETKKFDDKFDEKHFVIISNLSRRNLTMFQRAELLYEWWEREKKRSKYLGGKKTWRVRKGLKERGTDTHSRLAKRLGRMLGCGANTAGCCMKIIGIGNQALIEQLRNGNISIRKAYEISCNKKLKTPKDYGGYKKYKNSSLKICLNCGQPTKTVNKDECHVHDRVCCTKCRWGF